MVLVRSIVTAHFLAPSVTLPQTDGDAFLCAERSVGVPSLGEKQLGLCVIREIDYLLMVDDEARQGALRFKASAGGPFLAEDRKKIPPLIELPRLLSAAENVLSAALD